MYSFDSRVRYSETGENGRLSIRGMIDYMQDCSTFQSEDAGVGVRYFEESHKAWMLSSWRIRIRQMPRLGERIRVGTWPTSFKGLHGFRDFLISSPEGEVLVQAHSVWFLYDTQKNVPLRVGDIDREPYGATEPPLDMGPDPGRIKLPDPEHFTEGEPVRIQPHHLDTNHHVNNAWYVEFAKGAIPQLCEIREIRAEYKKAALLGDVLIPRIAADPQGGRIVVLAGENGEISAAAAFS